MYRETLTRVRHRLPDKVTFTYHDDRQSPWLLARLMPDAARVADLRRAPFGKLLQRPGVRPMLARSGGVLARRDVLALAHADQFDRIDHAGPAAQAALDAIWKLKWSDFELTFADWGTGANWRHMQISRKGGSLVIQLGFPSDHARLMGQHLGKYARRKFEEHLHPVRVGGRPTLAWARVDFDPGTGEALIEEVQCDWLRLVAAEMRWLAEADPRSRNCRAHQAYQRALFAQYARIWPQAMLLATLVVLYERLDIRRVWMHQAEPGALLKGITGPQPPRSLYSALPRAFCFVPVAGLPQMLQGGRRKRQPRFARDRLRRVEAMARIGRAVFWRLDL